MSKGYMSELRREREREWKGKRVPESREGVENLLSTSMPLRERLPGETADIVEVGDVGEIEECGKVCDLAGVVSAMIIEPFIISK